MGYRANILRKGKGNMKKHNTKSWKEAFRLNRRGFLYIFRSHPQMILSKTLQGVWAALTPYVGIYFSARVIQELAGGRDPGQLSFWGWTAPPCGES